MSSSYTIQFDYIDASVHYQFMTDHGIVFPPGMEYQLCSLGYEDGDYEVCVNITKKSTDSDDDEDEKDNTPLIPVVEKCMIIAGSTRLTMTIFSAQYIFSYIQANANLKYIYIPLSFDGVGSVGKHRFITKYLVLYLRGYKAYLFDPMNNDSHLLCQNINYKCGSLNNLLEQYCKRINFTYVTIKQEDCPNLYDDTGHILIWCLWLVKNLTQGRRSHNTYYLSMKNLCLISSIMKYKYIAAQFTELMELCDKAQLEFTTAKADEEEQDISIPVIPEYVDPENQYDLLKQVLQISKNEADLNMKILPLETEVEPILINKEDYEDEDSTFFKRIGKYVLGDDEAHLRKRK